MAADHEQLLEPETSSMENLLEDFSFKKRGGGVYSASRTFDGDKVAALMERYREDRNIELHDRASTDAETEGYPTRARIFYSGGDLGTLHFISGKSPEEWDPENPVLENYKALVR